MNSYYFYAILATLFISLLPALIIYLKADFLKSKLSRVNCRWIVILVTSFIFVYFLTFSILAVLKYNAYNTIVDFGRVNQVIWNTLQGNLFGCTWDFGNASRLIGHAEFIHLLIAPLYALYSDPKLLLLLQTLLLSLGAFPVFWIAKQILKSRFAALCFAIAYLLYPSLQYGNLAEFHTDMLATTFLLFTFYYLIQHAWLKYSVFLLLSLMTREYVSLIAVMLGLYILFAQRKSKIACFTIIVGILWFFFTVKIIPLLSGYDQTFIYNKLLGYRTLGSSPQEAIDLILAHPITLIMKQVNMKALSHTALLLLPLGFISLFHPKTLVLLLPIFVATNSWETLSYTNHHNGTMIPFIFISAIFGSAFFIRKINAHFNKDLTYSIAVFVLSCSFFSAFFYGPSPLSWRFWDKSSYRYWGNLHQFKVSEHDKIADKFVEMIPQPVSVSASNHLVSHLSQRETIYRFPHPQNFNDVDYILLDLLEYFPLGWNPPREKEMDALRELLIGNEFKLTDSEDGFLLFKKNPKEDAEYYNHFSIIKEAHPQHVVNLSFGSRLLLIGYDLNTTYLTRGSKQRIIYYWKILNDFDEPFSYSYFGSKESLDKDYIIIDTLSKDDEELRIIHLPTYILHPPNFWKKGAVFKEEFDFFLPQDFSPDNYSWRTGLYVAAKLLPINTAKGNLVPGTKEISLKTTKLK